MKRGSLIALTCALIACRGTTNNVETNTTVAVTPAPVPVAPDAGAVAQATIETPVREELPNTPARETPDAPFRAQAPEPLAATAFVAPTVQRFRLANGLEVLLVERHDLPIVVAQYVTRRGADDVAPAKSGVAMLTAALLEQGTATRSAEALSDAYAALGAEHGAAMDWDGGGAFIKVASPQFSGALELLADVVQHPAFAADELERARRLRLAAIRSERDSPRAVASVVTARAVFGEAHPYSRPVSGVEASVTALTRDDIVAFYRSHFGAADGALLVSGDVTAAALRPLLDRTFGAWRPEAPLPRQTAVAATPAAARRVWLVDRPGAAQSAVLLAAPGVARNDRDYPAILVMNAILGGLFSSRINLNLRERHEYTYGASSRFAMRRGAGPFVTGGAIVTAHTADAVTEILSEIARMRDADVTADELSTARTRIVESYRAQFATLEDTAHALSDLFMYRLPRDEFARYIAAINRVSAADVRRVARRLLLPDTLSLTIVGDRGVTEASLRALNRGAIELRDADGAPFSATQQPTATTPAAGTTATTTTTTTAP